MIQVGETYETFGGQNVKIVTRSGNQFTGDNGVWYDKFGRTERGHDLSLIVITVQPAYPDEQLSENEQELLQALKDLLAVECIDDHTRAYDKAKDVIAKFERVL